MSLLNRAASHAVSLTESDFAGIRRQRAAQPESIALALSARRRRPLLVGDQRLFIIAADHPARGALGVRGDAMAMASRYDLLERL
ncbi:MAG TPA: hypothetical protein VIJ76_00435, partial [Galbitalea sp.]